MEMEIFNISDISEIKEENKKRVAALGFFDGIHKAHQKIIGSAVEAAEKGFISAVITLDKSPKEYLSIFLTPALLIKSNSSLLMSLFMSFSY